MNVLTIECVEFYNTGYSTIEISREQVRRHGYSACSYALGMRAPNYPVPALRTLSFDTPMWNYITRWQYY